MVQDREAAIDALTARAYDLPTVKRVLDKQRKTFAEAQRRRAAGVMTYTADTPMRASLVPMVVERASGSTLYDLDGNAFIDLQVGFWTGLLGHSPQVVVDAVQREIANGTTVGVGHVLEGEICELFIEHVECAEMCCLTSSGTESLMHAVKLSRAATRRPLIAKFDRHYHGHYDNLLVDLVSEFGRGLPGQDPTLVLPRTPAAFDIIRKHRDELACVVIEPAAPTRDAQAHYDISFFQELRQITQELGIVLVFDEVFRGFRNRFGATLDPQGVFPDLACFGKIVGGGLPLAAVVGRRSIMQFGQTTGNAARDQQTRVPLIGTYSGNRISCAAGLAQLRFLAAHQNEVYPYIAEKADWLVGEINAHAAEAALPIGAAALGGGLMSIHPKAIVVDGKPGAAPSASPLAGMPMDPALLLHTYLRDHGVYLGVGPALISYAHRPDDVIRVSAAFKAAMHDLVQDGCA